MQLIQWQQKYNILIHSQNFINTRKNIITNLIQQFSTSILISDILHQLHQQNSYFYFNYIPISQFGVQIFAKSSLSFNQQYFISQFTLFKYKIIKTTNQVQKSTIIRYFLTKNLKNLEFSFHINPINGQISIISHQKYLLTLLEDQFNIIEHLNSLFKYQKLMLQNVINIILQNLFLKLQNFKQQNNKFSKNQLKSFVKVSSGYAWKMLKSLTRSKKEKHKLVYSQVKKQFLENCIQESLNIKIINIKFAIQDQIKKIQKFTEPSAEIQKQFQNTYLSKIGVNLNSRLINEITLTSDILKYLIRKKQAAVECHEYGKIFLAIKQIKSLKALMYQKNILSKFQNYEYMGFPKYYIVKNLQIESQHYLITNLTFIINFKKYLKNNYQTISVITKLHLLHQIALAIKYCRDNYIVFHNLIPEYIYVKRGLFIKISNFSNSFHKDIGLINDYGHESVLSVLPYVSNQNAHINSNYGDEKSDSYSFGNILYQVLYGKTPFHMKYGMSYPNVNGWVDILWKPILIGIQKQYLYGNQFYKILTYLSLQCVNHEKIMNQSKGNTDECNDKDNEFNNIKITNIKSRPYIDWLVVIIRCILENQKRRNL